MREAHELAVSPYFLGREYSQQRALTFCSSALQGCALGRQFEIASPWITND